MNIYRDKTKIAMKKKVNIIPGYHIITRDTGVLNGAYVPASNSPVIYVFWSSTLNKMYNKVINQMHGKQGLLNIVYDVVKEQTKVYEPKQIINKIREIEKGRESVTLEEILRVKAGICKHDALACAALLEKLKEDGHVSGTARVHRQTVYDGKYNGGHAWCHYTNSVGKKFILDVAIGYVGPIEGGKYPYF